MSGRFVGKNVLVTGGSRGIGKAIVKGMVSEGANVFALGRSGENLAKLKEEIPSVNIVQVDLCDWEAARIKVEELGVIDLLVNNAGMFLPKDEFYTIEKEMFDAIINTNVKSVFNLSQIVARGLILAGRSGAIVNISSIAGAVPRKRALPYSTSKAMLEMMTKCLALELGPHNIRVNSVQPTLTPTDMSADISADDEFIGSFLRQHPLGKFAKLDDVVNAVLFLLGDEAAMITGTALPVEGGFLLH